MKRLLFLLLFISASIMCDIVWERVPLQSLESERFESEQERSERQLAQRRRRCADLKTWLRWFALEALQDPHVVRAKL